MFIYQNGNLYIQDGNTLVGVEIHSDKILKVEDERSNISDSALYLTLDNVQKKFPQSTGGVPTFKKKPLVEEVVEEVIPEVVKEVKHDTTRTVSKSTRGRSRK